MRSMYYNEPEKSNAEQSLLQELNAYRKNGCQIFMDGRPASPEKIAYACVREEAPYMRDFISDGSRAIRKINFIRVNEEADGNRQSGNNAGYAKNRKQRTADTKDHDPRHVKPVSARSRRPDNPAKE